MKNIFIKLTVENNLAIAVDDKRCFVLAVDRCLQMYSLFYE
jgi:ABC-type branched-subunit amino acid transport system ATPase component